MSEASSETPTRVTLRDFPLAARLVLSGFLISVGIGYLSALVQLHFQHAKPGEPLPDKDDAAGVYHGKEGMSTFERLIRADESKPLTSSGSMRSTFFKKSAGWRNKVKDRLKEMKVDQATAEKAMRKERELEIEALLLWIRNGATEEGYESQPLPDDFFKRLPEPLEDDHFQKKDDGKRHALVSVIITDRCARCPPGSGGGAAGQIRLDTFDHVELWVKDGASRGMSLMKLAQSTHVHLLGFSMLYGLTGLILAFSSYPGWLRLLLCPLPLVFQVIDISFWWLGRVDPMFAHWIVYSGGVVALGLMLHIVLSLLNMYGVPGKLVLLFMFVAAGGGGFYLKVQVIDPYLEKERSGLVSSGP